MKKYIVFAVVVLIFLVVALLVTTKAQSASYTSTQRNKELAHEIANMMRYRGFPEDHPIIVACQDWWQEEDKKEEEIVEYTTKEQRWQHPVASADWQILRENGLSEVCAAAIIGNYMAESGGHTLDYDPYLRVGGFYGKAMWSEEYFPEVVGQSSIYQTEYTIATLERQFGRHLNEFLQETDVRRAAMMFNDYYERPAERSYKRADNAEIAYRFFVGE